MPRILSIDYGTARIGLAISDPNKKIGLPLCTLQAAKEEKASAQVVSTYVKKQNYSVEKILIGLPLHLDGKESPMSQKVRLFKENLEKHFTCPIEFVDERLSSSFIENSLKELYNRKQRAKKVDEASACLFLQEYLEKIKNLSC